MGRITIDQSHQVLATLAVNADWDEIDFIASGLQDLIVRNPKEAGREFTSFLKNGGKMSIGGNILHINRSTPFAPASFIGDGWTIWKGPADGNGLEGEEEYDTRSTALTELDLTKVKLVTMLKSGETSITGEERLKRLKEAGHIRLDAKIFQTLWENKPLIPESWKEKINGNTKFVSFDGTVLRSSGGDRCILYLYWLGDKWHWLYDWLVNDWYASHPSAVLAS